MAKYGSDDDRSKRPRKGRPEGFPRGHFSQSLERGLEVLACFSPERPVLCLREVADAVGLSTSTTHRYVVTLAELGYLSQDSDRRYRLGLRVTDLGMSALNRNNLRDIVLPYQRQLLKKTGLSTGLVVLDGLEIVYLERLGSYVNIDESVPHRLPSTGSRLTAYRTAAGKALLANLPDAERARTLDQITFEQNGLTVEEARRMLVRELEQIALQELASSEEEVTHEILSIAVPIRDGSTEVVAALNLLASRQDSTVGDLVDNHRQTLRQTAREISRLLG